MNAGQVFDPSIAAAVRSTDGAFMRGTLALLLAVGVLPLTLAVSEASAAERPNIVFVMTDDQGYWDTGAAANPHIDTPAMDQVAAEGVQLRRYYAAPVCAPTRAGIMTGRYYLRTGLYNTRFGGDSLGLQEVTVAELLKDAGYRTGLFGKWHLGQYPGYQPQERGFDEFFGHYHGHIERYQFPDQVYHNGRQVEARGYVSDLFTQAAMDFIDQSVQESERPFFCALMFNAPHSPWLLDTSHFGQPLGDRLLTKYLERGLPLREARIYALIERVDQNLRRLLDHLEARNVADNTVVVFTSDNGGVSQYWNGGMKGRKSSPYEGGVRVPCYVRWPKRIPAGNSIDAQTSHVDWLPTFCELAGTDVPSDRTIDGRSLVSLLSAENAGEHHQYVYHTWDRYVPNPDRRWSISDDRWKLVGLFGAKQEPNPAKWRLYDLLEDPGESRNRLRDYPQHVSRLRAEFLRWFEDVTEGQEYVPVRIPVGVAPANAAGSVHSGTVDLPPSWAEWTGDKIEYVFDGYDWDTIEGWKNPGERASWRLDVRRAGTYRVLLSYGCRPLDAGGVLRIRVGDQTMEHTVQPTATADQFAVLAAGELQLAVGPAELTAEVVRTAGTELMRLNAVRLQWQAH